MNREITGDRKLIPTKLITHLHLLLFLALLSGCATPAGEKLSRVSVGMTKSDVIAAMGQPTSDTGSNNIEMLHYALNAKRALFSWDFDEYYVRLVNGRVESYGKMSDLEKSTLQKKTQDTN